MPSLLLYLVIALFAWMGFTLFGSSGTTTLTPGFLIVMACLSVLIWDRIVAPMMHRAETRRARQQARPTLDRNAAARPAASRTAPMGASQAWRPQSA